MVFESLPAPLPSPPLLQAGRRELGLREAKVLVRCLALELGDGGEWVHDLASNKAGRAEFAVVTP